MESCESEEGREAIEEFWLRAIDSRCEGLMIKVRVMFFPFLPLTHWKICLKLLDNDNVLEGAGPRKDTSRKQALPSTYEPGKTAYILL